MPPTIEMKPLSQKKRRFVFILSLTLFVLAVPFSVFYAIGYRFDFTEDLTGIRSVGGMYVRNDTDNTLMFINDEPVKDMRVFQKAAYIQNLEAGMHRLHVQGDGVYTWVKDLPVYAHYVTEVASFNVPRVPQIRVITQWTDPSSGAGVLFGLSATSTFSFASTTNALQFSTSTASATPALVANPEHAYVESLIASSSEMRVLLNKEQRKVPERSFTFGETPTTTVLSDLATTTIQLRDHTLYENNGEVYISWDGSAENIPYYYCIVYSGKEKTIAEYGAHVYTAIYEQLSPTVTLAQQIGNRLCRQEIRIDRLGQDLKWFGFFPDSTDVVLMHLQDGLYAVEVDDRAWQNTQLLYPGEEIVVVQDGGRIYVQDGDYLLEVFTQITN